MRDRVCIIILHVNQLDETLATLNSLSKIDYKFFTPLVVIQESTPESVAAIRWAFPRVPLFETSKNLGVAAGNNTAIQWALKKPFKWILLLHNPTKVSTDFLKKMMQATKENTAAKLFKTTSRTAHLIHRDIFETMGLFDPRFFLFWDKTDFYCRARRKGFTDQTVTIEGLKEASISSFLKRTPTSHYHWWRSHLLWIEKNHPPLLRKQIIQPKIFRLLRIYGFHLLSGAKNRTTQIQCIKASLKGALHYFFKKFEYNK
jgi:hypothetical protein